MIRVFLLQNKFYTKLLQNKLEYLSRCKRWDWYDDNLINIYDVKDQKHVTLNSFETFVFHEADWYHTIEEIILFFASHYESPKYIPPFYQKKLIEAKTSLIYVFEAVKIKEKRSELDEGQV